MPALTTRSLATDPIYVTTRVFATDDGTFRYEIKLWLGDVDVHNEPPNSVVTSKPYKTRKSAGRAAARRLEPFLSA